MKRLLPFTAFVLVMLSGCTDDSNTRRTLEDAGYSNISTGDYSWWTCGDDDTFATQFTATNPAGKRVSGTVCCGWLTKGCTIRF